MKKPSFLLSLGFTAIGTVAGFGLRSVLADGIPTPNPLYYAGTLTEGGALVTGIRAITLNLWPDATTSGSPLCTTVASTANVVNGRFRIALASSCKAIINQNANAFVEVIDGATSLGRSPVGAVPYAVESDHAVTATTAANGAPTGTIAAYAGATTPTGWLSCDGSSVLRTTYPGLFGAIGTAWGAADAAHFNLPDLRGQFLRGVDNGAARDPDATARTAAASGGNLGDAVGSIQADAFQGWKPQIITRAGDNSMLLANNQDYVLYSATAFSGANSVPIFRDDTYSFLPFSTYGTPRVSSETRPRNAGVVFIIKY